MTLLLLVACEGNVALSSDTGTDTGDTGEVVVDPVPDMSTYTTDLSFTYDTWGDSYDCSDESAGTAVEITEGDEYDALKDTCALCDHFYVVTLDHTKMCDSDWLEVPQDDYRGLVLDEEAQAAQVYRFDENDDGSMTEMLLDGSASWDGWVLTFGSTIDWLGGDMLVEGTITFVE